MSAPAIPPPLLEAEPPPRPAAVRPEPSPDVPAAVPRPIVSVSVAVNIVAALALVFVCTVSLIGPVRHARDQQTAYAVLRGQLANATAMVTQLDDDGKLYPLGTPMAVLDIPQIGLREVVFEGTTSGVLESGPGHRRDSPLPGQAGTSVILGRQAAYGGPFKHLQQLSPGQVFTVTTGQGQQVFRIVTVRRAGQLQPPDLAAGKGRLTLVTAAGTPFVPEGLLRVDADLVSPVQPAGRRPLGAASLPLAERSLGTEGSGVLVELVLLGQLMLVAALGATWARYRWGRAQVWLAGVPVLLALGVALSNVVARLLPNLM